MAVFPWENRLSVLSAATMVGLRMILNSSMRIFRKFKSRPPDFFQKQALRRERRRAFSLLGQELRRRARNSKHDFEDAALRGILGGKPLIAKGLRKFKNF